MVERLRPARGGFLRPIGCAQFIISFLKGEGPNGSTKIDPGIGAPQTDVHAEYKSVLHRAFAEDMVAAEEERRARRRLPPLAIEEAERRTTYYMGRIPMKLTRMRYHSFLVYFGMLKRLGWVEETDKTEPSAIQDNYPPGPPRRYYRLTAAGRAATPLELSDPLNLLYHYPRKVRSAKNRKYATAKA